MVEKVLADKRLVITSDPNVSRDDPTGVELVSEKSSERLLGDMTPLAGFESETGNRRKTCLRAADQSVCEETWLCTDDGDSPADAVRIGGFARLPGSLALRPW